MDEENYDDTGDGEKDSETAPHGGRNKSMSAVDEAVVGEKVRILGCLERHTRGPMGGDGGAPRPEASGQK